MTTLAHFTEDLTARCRWARTQNDGFPSGAWATGEQLAVALILGNARHLKAMDYTAQEATQRLYGEGWFAMPEDFINWLEGVRTALTEHGKEG